jgi:hypothetical protein
MRRAGIDQPLDAHSTTYWGLQRWLRDFHITDAVPIVLGDPAGFGRHGRFWRMFTILPVETRRAFMPLAPGFIFVLRKPL